MAKHDERPGAALVAPRKSAEPWRGDEHQLQADAAAEAGLVRSEVEVDLYTSGFSAGMTVEDPYDGAIVATGRTVLKQNQLQKALLPALRYLELGRDVVRVQVHDGNFELRVAKGAADRSSPALDAGKVALGYFLGFGIVGLVAYQALPAFVAPLMWGLGLLLGGWRLRRGLASGRAMLAARLALALGMLAHEEQLILPPAGDRSSGGTA